MSVKYKIRNEVHKILGTYSEEQILRRIDKGKYTGEEEISSEPFDRWQKLSSHPEFYDAFLKRIYLEKYLPPESKADLAKPKKPASEAGRTEHKAQRGEPTHIELAAEGVVGGATEHLDLVGPSEGKGTIQQELLDELFSQKREISVPKAVPLEERQPEPLAATFEARPTEEEAGHRAHKALAPENRRRLILFGSLGILLLVLFQLGSTEDSARLVSEAKETGIDALVESLKKPANESAVKSKGEGLLQEGTDLYGLDTLPGYLEAARIFESALELGVSPSVAQARYAMAVGRLALLGAATDKQKKLAWERIQQGRLEDPQQPLFYHAEALLDLAAGKKEEAEQTAQSSFEADPGNAEGVLLLAELQGTQNLGKELAELPKNPVCAVRGHYLTGRAAFEVGQFQRAKTEALEALKYNPFHLPAFYLLAEASSKRNEIKEAKAFYETAGRLARFGDAQLVGRSYDRLAELNRLLGNKKSEEEALLLAYHYGKSDAQLDRIRKIEHSQERLLELAAAAEFDERYLSLQADTLEKEGKVVEAIKFRYAAYLLAPSDASVLAKLGALLERRAASYADFRQVVSIYERAIQRQPEYALAYIRLGLIETDHYNFERAQQLLDRALELAPDEALSYVALGKHYFKRQDYNTALQQFLEAAKVDPSDSEVLYYAGVLRVLFKKDSAKDAMRFFYQAYTLNPENYESLVEWLKLKVETHDKPFAIKFVRNLLETDPKNAALHWAYGEIYLANSEPYRAISHFHRSLDLDNRAPRTRMSLGRAHESIGELDKAVAEYRLATLLDPRNGEGAYKAARLLIQARNFVLAEEVLKGLTDLTPNYPGAYRELAQVYRAKKQPELAMAAMERECANNPRNTKFTLELGEIYLEYQKYEKALAEFSKIANLPSVAKAPEFVYDKIRAYLLISRTYRAQDKFDLAEGSLKLAVEIDAEDPELHKELGYVYHGQQREKESVREFEYYLGRNPAAEDAAAIRGMINHMRIE